MSKWHTRKIEKGELGELSKIYEEYLEALDAEEQGQVLMLLFGCDGQMGLTHWKR